MKEKLNEKSLKKFVPPPFSSFLFALVCVCLSLYSASFQLQIIVHNKNTMNAPVAAVEDGWEEEVKSVVGLSSRSHAEYICLQTKNALPLCPFLCSLLCIYVCICVLLLPPHTTSPRLKNNKQLLCVTLRDLHTSCCTFIDA